MSERQSSVAVEWWLASAFNDLSGNFRLTLAKKSGIAKIGQILMEYRFDNELIFSHKLTSCC